MYAASERTQLYVLLDLGSIMFLPLSPQKVARLAKVYETNLLHPQLQVDFNSMPKNN